MKYSEKLIKEYQECMKSDYGYETSDEEAQLHLSRLTKLFVTSADINTGNNKA